MKIRRHQGSMCRDGNSAKRNRVFFGLLRGGGGRPVHRVASRPWIFKTILLLEGSETVSALCGSMPSNVLVNSLCPV